MYVCVRIYLDMCVHTREDGTMYNLIYWYLHVKCGTKRIENVTRYFNISIYIYVPNTSISVCIRTFACMYFAVCKCIYTQSVCVCIYIYIYIYIYAHSAIDICTFSIMSCVWNSKSRKHLFNSSQNQHFFRCSQKLIKITFLQE